MTTQFMPTVKSQSYFWDRLPRPLTGARALFAGAACAALVTGFCATIAAALPAHAVAMFYMPAVIVSAVAFGVLAGLTTATCSFFAYNYFFLQPTYTLTISDPQDLIALLVFFAVAIASGSLAGRLRELGEQARRQATSLESLNALTTRLANAINADEIAAALVDEASAAVSEPAALLRTDADGLKTWFQTPKAEPLNTSDWQTAQRCALTGEKIYPAVPGWQGSHYEFRPVKVRDAITAVLGVRQLSFDDANDATLDAMVDQTCAALERLSLQQDKAAAEKNVEAERLRSALLSSVSHDIKTPLAAIQGAASSLRELGQKLPEASKAELIATIEEETLYLSRFVTNMLDMMRLQSGPAALAQDWIDLADTIGSTVARARKLLPNAQIELDVKISPALIRGDETLLQHVIFNVLENAGNASPPDERIVIVLRRAHADDGYAIEVEDSGSGISAEALPRIFDKFYRAPGTVTHGSGLGLAIGKEVMTALGGSISAESPIANGRGTRVTLLFPIAKTSNEGAGP